MANYSDIFPLNVGGSSIAGFNWTEKTADFTAAANEAYYCDTALGDILMTLPSNPNPGDEVAFLLIGANAVNITTTDNIKSAPLATDYLKQVTENYLMVVLFYVDGTTGWNWDARYDSFIGNVYVGNGDLYFNNVVLFLKGNGTNGSTTIVDSSPLANTISVFGNTQISTAQSKYGGSSISFDGTGDYLSFTGTAIGTDVFTAEAWIYPTVVEGVGGIIGANRFETSGPSWVIRSNMVYQSATAWWNSYASYISSASNTVLSNQWHHVALVRDATNIRLYVNGINTNTSTTNYTNDLSLTSYVVGRTYSDRNTEYFVGFLDSLRVTKGVARYNANFNPETDTFLDI